jgi:hypothetical protein
LAAAVTSHVSLFTVIVGHSASEDARKRAYDPAIHPFRQKMDARVKPGHEEI